MSKYDGMYLKEAELKLLLSHVPANRRLMVLVTYWHGLRVSEITQLRGREIQGGHVWCKRKKRSKTTIQPFKRHPDPDLDEWQGLMDLAAKVKADERCFPMTRFGFYDLMHRAGIKAGFPAFKGVRPHILKHSIAQNMVKAGVKLPAVQRALGHARLSSTGVYTENTDDEASREIETVMGLIPA